MRLFRRTPPSPPTAREPEVTRCAYLVNGDVALVRVAGTGHGSAAALVVDDGVERHFEPLPEPAATAEYGWRSAFAVPAELVGRDARFDVELDDGTLLEAPHPTPESTTEPEDLGRIASLERRLRLVQAAEESRGRKLVEAWSQCNELGTQLDASRAEADTLRGELAGVCELLAAAHASERRNTETLVAEQAAELHELRATVAELQGRLDRERSTRWMPFRRRRERARAEAATEAGFAKRRAVAVAESLRERVRHLERALSDEVARADALRLTLAGEREKANAKPPARAWTADDYELLARIDTAKILARSGVGERPQRHAQPTC